MPDCFRGRAALVAEWKRQAERLLDLGILTTVDDDALAALVVFTVRFREQVEGGAPVADLTKTAKELRQLWSRFGLTPADRVRVKVSKPAVQSKLERFRNGARGSGAV